MTNTDYTLKTFVRRSSRQIAFVNRFFDLLESKGYETGPGFDFSRLNNLDPVPLICPAGHNINVRPTHLLQYPNRNSCRACTSVDCSQTDFSTLLSKRGFLTAPDFKYQNLYTKVSLICPQSHVFSTTPYRFIKGAGCRICSKTGFDSSKPAILYYLRFIPESGLPVYKIGITNRTVEYRYRQVKTPYSIVWQKQFQDGGIARSLESKAKRSFDRWRCIQSPIDKLSTTELFTRDVLPTFEHLENLA